MKVKTAVITAAGFGTRFLPIVKSIPKEMLPIVDKPILQYVVEECIDAGMEKIIVVVREGNNVINDYFTNPAEHVKEQLASVGKESRFEPVEKVLGYTNVKIITQYADLPYGNGSPVISAKEHLEEGEPFAVLFADDMVLTNGASCLKQLVEFFEKNDAVALMAVQKMPKSELKKYGIITPKEVIDEKSGIIESIHEKPNPGEEKSDLAGYGRFVLSYDIFKYLKADAQGLDNEVWLQDANSKLAHDGKFMYKVIDGEWYTTGDPVRYFEALVKYFLADGRYKDEVKEILSKLN